MPQEKLLLTYAETAALTGLSKRTLQRLGRCKILRPVKPGGKATRFRRSDVERWIDRGCPGRLPRSTRRRPG